MAGLPQGLIVLITIVGIFVTIVWIFLPFAIFGIKPLLEQQIAMNKKILQEMKRQRPAEDDQPSEDDKIYP